MQHIRPSVISPIHHQPFSDQAAQNRIHKDVPLSDDFLANLLEQKDVTDKLTILESLKFEDTEKAKLELGDEVFHVKTPDGRRFTVTGQRSPVNSGHIHVRVPNTEELTSFTLKQGSRDVDHEFVVLRWNLTRRGCG